MSVCLAEPKRGRVHELRKTCRKIEASIALIDRLPGMPSHRTQSEEVLRNLRRIRRAAGRVRDLDVQRRLLQEDVLRTRRVGGGAPKVMKAAETLRRLGKRRRQVAADKLLRTLRKRQARVAGSLEELTAALAEAEALKVSPGRLLERVEQAFDASPRANRASSSEAGLHDTRKRAKQARYQADLVIGSSRSAEAARERFEQLQALGGEWHDWLELTKLAQKRLGKQHPATSAFAGERDRTLQHYRQLLG